MNMTYEKTYFSKKDPPEKMMQNDLGINSRALLTSRFMYFLFFHESMQNVILYQIWIIILHH